MPLYEVDIPGKGRFQVESPTELSETQVYAAVQRQLASAPPKPEEKPSSGILASAAKGLESLISSGRTAAGSVFGDANEAAKAGLARGEDISKRYADDVSLDKVVKAYNERGILPAAGEAISQIPKALAEQAPNIASTLGSARLGAAAGSVFGPVGTLVGGTAGAVVPGLIQMFGSNVERQASEQQKAGKPVDVDVGAAGAAAVPQAALDAAATFIPLGGKMVSKLTGIPAEALIGRSAAQTAKLAEEKLLATLGKGLATGAAAEIPTEVAQQILERAQAGLPLTSPDALKEYGETAYQTGLLAPLGAMGRFSEKSGARAEIAAKKELDTRQKQVADLLAEDERKRQAAADEAAEQARRQTAPYALEIEQKYNALEQQAADLKAQLRPITKDSSTADREFNKDIQAQLKALGPDLRSAAQEYNRVAPILEPLKQQAAAQQAAAQAQLKQAEDAELQKYQLAAMRRQQEMTPGNQQTIPGLEPRETEVQTTTPMPSPEQITAKATDFAEKLRGIQQTLEAHQELESQAAANGDIDALRGLRQRRQMLRNEQEYLTKQLDALGGVPVDNVALVQNEIAAATQKLKAMSGPGYDPDKADKLIAKIDTLQAKLKGMNVPEGAGRQASLEFKGSIPTNVETTEQYNRRTYEPGGYGDVDQTQRGQNLDLFMEQQDQLDFDRREGQTDSEVAAMEKLRIPTERTDQGTLFGNESGEGIQTGTSTPKTRAQLISDLRIARAARNAQANGRAGSTEAVSQAIEALRDFDARQAAEDERKQTSKRGEIDEATQEALAGAKVPERERAVQAARELRDNAYADIVETVSKYNQGKAKQAELQAARDKLLEYSAREVEFRRGEAMDPTERQSVKNEIDTLVQDLVSRFGDTRSVIDLGPESENRYVNSQRDNGQFTTKYGGPGTGPTGMGLPNVESRVPGRQTFGSPFAAAKSIQEGIDQIINRSTNRRTGVVESTFTPDKVTPEAFKKQLERLNTAKLSDEAKALVDRVKDDIDVVSKNSDLVQDISDALYRSGVAGQEVDFSDINARLDQLEQGKRSETEQQRDGTIKTAVQGELFKDASVGQVFDTPEQFRSFMASDALNTMRQLKGIPGETAERIEARLKPLRAQIDAYERQMEALRQQYEQAVAQRNQAEGMHAEPQAALAKAKALHTQMQARLEQALAGVEAEYVKASLRYNFSSKVLDDLTKMIEKNEETFNRPLDSLEREYLAKIADAERDLGNARKDIMMHLRHRIVDMRASQYTPEQIADALGRSPNDKTLLRKLAAQKRDFEYTPKQIANELGFGPQSLALLEELAARPETIRKTYERQQKLWLGDKRVVAAMDEHLRLTMELAQEEKNIARLGRDLMNASLKLDIARRELYDDPRVKARFDRQQELVRKATSDMEAARQLLGETDATVKAISTQINRLGDMQDRLSAVVKSSEKQVADRAAERVRGGVPESAEERDYQARRKQVMEERSKRLEKRAPALEPANKPYVEEQARLEKVENDVNRTVVSFEPRRQKEEKRIRNAEQIRQLQEQVEMGTPEEKADAQAQLDAFRAKLEKLEAGAAKKLQGAINAQNKLVEQIKANDAALAADKLTAKKRTELEARRDSLNEQLKARSEKLNAQLGSVFEPVETLADKRAAREEQYKADVADRRAALEAAEKRKETLEAEKLAPRKVGPAVRNAITAGNVRTGNLETTEQRRMSTKNPVQQSGKVQDRTRSDRVKATKDEKGLAEAIIRRDGMEQRVEQLRDALVTARDDEIKPLSEKLKQAEAILKVAEDEVASFNKKRNYSGVSPSEKFKRVIDAVEGDTDVESLSQLAATANVGPAVKVETESNAANVMDEITATSTNPLNRAVAERLRTLLSNTKVKIVDDLRDDDGVPVYGSAKIDGSEIALDARHGLNEQTVLHEGVHAAVERALRLPDAQLTEDQRAAKRELQALYEAFKKDKNAPNENAKSSLSEFVSEALSDAPLQSYLEAKPWTLKNMWNAVKNGILRMIGVDVPTNMRDATLAAADRLMMRVPRPTAADVNLLTPQGGRLYRINDDLRDALNVTGKLIARQKPWTQRVRDENTGLAFSTNYIDRFAGFEKLAKVMPKLEGTQMMYFLRMYDQRMNFVAQSAGNGALELRKLTRKDGGEEYLIESKQGSSLRTVVETLKEAKPIVGNVDAVNELFTAYLAAKRAERVGFNKLNFGAGINEAELRKAIDAVERQPGLKQIFERARNEYNKYNEGLVRFAQQTGALSKEVADTLLANKDYVPYYRATRDGSVELLIGNESPIKVGNIKDQPYLQELVGGEEQIFDFFTSSLQNTNMLVDMALRNLSTKNAVVELAKMGGAIITDGHIHGPDVVKFMDKGKERYARIDTDKFGVDARTLVHGMEGVPTQITGVMRLATMPTRLLRKAVTANPMYALRQLFRDSLAAPILAGADFNPIMAAFREIGSATGDTLTNRGITGGQIFTGSQEDMRLIMREIADGKTTWAKVLGKMEAFGMEADALTRRAQYNSYIKQGLSEMEATLMALESMNFNKRGASPGAHMLNALYPFFNAQIQGLNVLYKAMTGNATAAEKLRIKEKFIARGMTMMAISAMYAASMQDDEAYKNATPDQKYGNWFVRLPGVDEPLRLPVPFEVGYIFKSLPEALVNIIMNGEKGTDEAKEAFGSILRNVIPGGSSYGVPQILKPAVEGMMGKSFYTGRDMLSAKEQALRPEDQFRESTSEMAKALGSATGISPIKMEAFINGYFGTLGLVAMNLPNIGFSSKDSPEKAVKRLSDLPIAGSAFQPNDAGYIIDRAYEKLKEFQQVKASVDDLMARGEKARALALFQEKGVEYAAAEMAGRFKTDMQKIAQFEAAVRASDRTPEEKRALLDKARQAKINLAAQLREAADKTTRR